MDIRERLIVVGGGAGSLGAVIATDLIQRGARVAVLDIREPSETLPEPAFSVPVDIADDAAVTEALASVTRRAGKISALVNCAGLIHSEPLVNLMAAKRTHSVSAFESTVRSNLTATFVLGARIAEHMATSRTKGVIVNFSSIAASGNPGQSAYAAAKAGIEAMTAVWARELGPLGIRAVAIAPGFVDTPSTHSALNEQTISDLKRRTPLLRLARPEEIARTAAFALENDFITGTTIAVDGGLVL